MESDEFKFDPVYYYRLLKPLRRELSKDLSVYVNRSTLLPPSLPLLSPPFPTRLTRVISQVGALTARQSIRTRSIL